MRKKNRKNSKKRIASQYAVSLSELEEVVKETGAMEEDMEAKEKELYDLKHELIAAQIKLENCEKSLKSLRDENHEKDKKIIRLETELKEHKL